MKALVHAVLAVALAGCPDEQFRVPDPTFASIRDEVLTPRCAVVCHGAIEPPGHLDLETDPYQALVGVEAMGRMCSTSGLVRIEPGDPDHSLLFLKISAKAEHTDPPCGEGMPQGARDPLDADTIAAIEQWIRDGAPP
jgi:hypothetical protein